MATRTPAELRNQRLQVRLLLMKREPGEYLFQPSDVTHARRGRNMIRPGLCYSADSYSRAVARGVKRAKCEAWTVYGLRRLAGETADGATDPDTAAAMLGQACRLVPTGRSRSGHAGTSALFRWIVHGKRGVYLDGIKQGSGWVTSAEALVRFGAEVARVEVGLAAG